MTAPDQIAAMWTPELRRWAEEKASAAGFARVGIAGVGVSPQEQRDAERFSNWIEAGRAGEMEYLKRRDAEGRLLRSSVQAAIPWAQSVLVFAIPYKSEGPRSIDEAEPDRGWIARYAWSGKRKDAPDGSPREQGSDYHDELLDKLKNVEAQLRQASGCEARSYVDTGPFVERSLAARAGVGWIGKNTCVLDQELGSWVLLGAIVTSLRLPEEQVALPSPDRCGSCTRCIDACPTGALHAERQMDAGRCIAYLTIEKKGPIDEDLRPQMGRQVFGCDICQEVCPWNRAVTPVRIVGLEPREVLTNPELEWLAGMSSSEFRSWFRGSPLERTGKKRLHRNVAIAMGNTGDAKHLPRLRLWAEGPEPMLAETARWAIGRIEAAFHRPEEHLPSCGDATAQANADAQLVATGAACEDTELC